MATDDDGPKTSGLQVPTNLDTATTKMLASGNVADDSRVPEVEYNFSKGRHLKNVLVLSLAFTLVFTAFSALESLQSSINKDQGLGVYGLVFIYSAMIISCLFLAPPVISLLGCKWTITAAMATYTTYTLANFYAVWGTMAPASVILGLGGTLLWAAKSMYITETATQYAQITEKKKDVILPGFFGIFFGIVHTCRVWGNLISSLVLSQRPQNETEISDEVFGRCGATYCTGDENLGNVTNSGLDKPSEEKLQMLCGTYLACGLMAVGAVAIFLDDIHRHKSAKSQPKKRFSSALFVATFKHMRKPKQLLLIPITVYCSMQMGFFSSDFTKAFVSCSYGLWNVGFVMMTHGVSSSLNSIVIGRLAKRVRRPFFFTIAMLLHYGLLFTFLFWQPTPDGLLILYVLAGLWGAADAVWTTEINATVWGNLISSLVLSQRSQNETEIPDEVFSRCGATYCTGDENIGNFSNPGLDKPSEEKLLILCGTYFACGLIAVAAVAIFLDDLHRQKSAKSQPKKRFSSALFVATFNHMREPKQLLLIPITMNCSMQEGFFFSDFTKSFVSCSYGLWNVGYVTMTYGVTTSLISIVIGRLAKRVGRAVFFTLAMLLHYGLLFTLLFWQLTPDGLLILYVLAGLWGAAVAIWTTEINVLYGVLFHDSQEAAFSNYRLWRAIGFILAYNFSVKLCVFIKLYILMGTLALSMLGYLTVEFMERKYFGNAQNC